MKSYSKIILIVLLVFCMANANAQKTYINKEWESSGGAQGVINRTSSALDNYNNMVVVTNSINTSGNTDAVIKKYDNEGTLLWQQNYNGAQNGDDYGVKVAINGSNEILVAATIYAGIDNNDFALLKYSATGTLLSATIWAGNAGGHDVPSDLIVDGSGNVYIVGSTEASNTYADYAIVKYNTNNVLQWATTYDYNSLHDAATKVEFSGSNLAVIGASASNATNLDYATLTINTSSGAITNAQRSSVTGAGLDQPLAVKVDNSNNVYITGYVEVGGQKDIRTLKFDSNFTLQWTADINGNYDEVAKSIDVDNSGNVYITGLIKNANGHTNFLTVKYNSSGIIQWAKEFGDASDINTYGAEHIVVVDNEKLMVVGTIDNNGTNDFLAIAYSLSGGLIFMEEYDSNGADDMASSITIDGDDFFITGTSTNNGTRSTTVVKYEALYKEENPIYDTVGNPAAVDNELLIRFNPNMLIGDKINNTNITWGTLSDFVSQTALVSISNKVGFDTKNLNCYKMFPSQTETDTSFTSKTGKVIELPPLYATFGVVLPDGTDDTTAFFDFISAVPQVQITTFNQYGFLAATANDPLYTAGEQSGLNGALFGNASINIEPAWDYSTGDSNVVVGIYDSGINNLHEDMSTNGTLSGSVVKDGWDYIHDYNFDTDTYPDNSGHGSAVASIVGAFRNNGIGMAGVAGGNNGARGVTLHDMQLFDTTSNSCSTQFVTTLSVAADAIWSGVGLDEKVSIPQDIMNHSWQHGGGPNVYIREAFMGAYKADILMVVAAGNTGLAVPNSPCFYQSALATMGDNYTLKVGGNDSTGARADFSTCNRGMDLIAPATFSINSNVDKNTDTYPDTVYSSNTACPTLHELNGTSFAAPHASGVAALMVSYFRNNGSGVELAPEDIEQLMSRFTTDITAPPNSVGYDAETAWGRLNAGAIFDSLHFPKFRIQHEFFTTPMSNATQGQTNVQTCMEYSQFNLPQGVTNVTDFRLEGFNTHTIPVGFKIIGAWTRGSGSKHTYGVQHDAASQCLPTSTVSGYVPAPPDPEFNAINFSNTTASLVGHIYKVYNASNNFVGWLPVDTTEIADFAYTLFLVDTTTIGLGIDEESTITDFNLYPNPSSDIVKMQFNSSISEEAELTIVDMTGKQVKYIHKPQSGLKEVTFSVNELSPSIYFVILSTDKGKRVKKLIVD